MAEGDYTKLVEDEIEDEETGEPKQVWRWQRRAKNHRKIATSGEPFFNKAGARRAAKRVFGDEPKD